LPRSLPARSISVGTPLKGVITATSENMMREVGREKRANSRPVTAAICTMPNRISVDATRWP
jgi:hypothetical protein